MSALLHGLALWLIPASWVRWGEGDGGHDPGETSGAAWVPFSALDPLQIVDLSSTSTSSSSASPSVTTPDPQSMEPTPLPSEGVIDALLERSLDAGTPAVSSLRSGGEGTTPEQSRAPVPLGFRWPEYPDGVERAKGPVTVEVRVWVEADGSTGPTQIAKTSGIDALDRKAQEVAKGIRFEPAVRQGRPVAAWYRLPITFHP